MPYFPRHLEAKLRSFASFFKAVLVVGARQVGKSSLLGATFPGHRTVVFDALADVNGARRDPDLFLKNFPPPLVLFEVQYAPELLSALKRRLEQETQAGRYLLTGSHQLAVMRGVAESMAGRVGILQLPAMTPSEMAGRGAEPDNFIAEWVSRHGEIGPDVPIRPDPEGGLARFLWRGCMPGLLAAPDDLVPPYFASYTATYIERDVRMLGDVRSLSDFDRFLRLVAALTAQEINLSGIGREIGIAPSTARGWLELLKFGFQWRDLPPFPGQLIKRLSRRPKGHLADTGLACALLRIGSPAGLAAHPLFGALFESFVVETVVKNSLRLPVAPGAYHWRSGGGAEVDLVLEIDGRLFPIEVKASTAVSGHDARGLIAFRETYPRASAPGLIVYAGDLARRVREDVWAVPWRAL
ncbi:MAG: ATP-binding protein [Deltaproteobacteria bacterium]|nr:ATP-binding protein [Deltaproteobacteria bacterium]